MNSLGSSSKWPSYDSLRSTPSFLLSESEQTEDEADIFSEGEGESGLGKPFSAGEGATLSSGKRFVFPGRSDPPYRRSESGQAEYCPDKAKHPSSAAILGSSSVTSGDLAFAQKCADLHRFIRPLLQLLNGLKTGRFDRGLTSFQQSVAMDRLQRILGILQKPDMGEKYLRTLLQVEMMLKLWFPQVAFKASVTPTQNATPCLPSRWRQNQLHIPVKKRKMSWLDPDPSDTISPQCKRHQQGSCQAATLHDTATTTCLPRAPKEEPGLVEGTAGTDRGSWAHGDELTDSTSTLSSPSYLCRMKKKANWKRLEISPPSPSPCSSPATQDRLVSSSSTVPIADSP